MIYKFNYRGALNGKFAFEITGLAGLRDKAKQIESGDAEKVTSGIYQGYSGCVEIKTESEEFMIDAVDGPGWYLTNFNGSCSDKYETEEKALVAYIEERTGTRVV